MHRTPIKIPGKRNPRARKSEKEASNTNTQVIYPTPSPTVTSGKFGQQSKPRGRPLKLTPSNKRSEIAAPSSLTVKTAKKRSLKNIKSRLKMSLLEKLPIELLEKVYIYAMSIDLPRSSPIIAGKLSREFIYIQTIIAAFDPTWDACHGRSRNYEPDTSVASFQVNCPDQQVDSG
jgi:hypothetical protein